MTLITGIALVVLVVCFFACSLPWGGKPARFVGTPWEGPLVIAAVGSLFIGFVLVIAGWPQLGTVVR